MILRPFAAAAGLAQGACRAVLETVQAASCPVCGGPVGRQTAGACHPCWDEIVEMVDPPAAAGRLLATVTALGAYEGRLAGIIRAFKFGNLPGLGVPLGDRLARRLAAFPPACDLVVPVPLHWRRRHARGYNQAGILARRIARALGCTLGSRTLVRRRATAPQTGRSRRHRIVNLRGAFAVRRSVAGRRVLLVDDVITTGVTARECARMLLRCGARDVHVAAAARTLFGRT